MTALNDLYNDPGHSLLAHLFSQHPGAGEFVKGAQYEDRRDQIPVTAFAWPERQLFPVHSPAHAVVSFLYAKHGAAQTKVAAAGRRVPLVPAPVVSPAMPPGRATAIAGGRSRRG